MGSILLLCINQILIRFGYLLIVYNELAFAILFIDIGPTYPSRTVVYRIPNGHRTYCTCPEQHIF